MRRTPLKRTRMRRRFKSTKYARRERDVGYMLATKTLPCVAAEMSACSGDVQADHAGRRGLGQKCSDREVISLCDLHHRNRTDFSGPFKTWTKDRMRAWLVEMIARTQLLLAEVA